MKFRQILTNDDVLLERQEMLIPPPYIARNMAKESSQGYLIALKHDGFCHKEVIKGELSDFKQALIGLDNPFTSKEKTYREYIVPMVGNEYAAYIYVDLESDAFGSPVELTVTDIEGLWGYGQVSCINLAKISYESTLFAGIKEDNSEELEIQGIVDFLIGSNEGNRQGITAKKKFEAQLLKDVRVVVDNSKAGVNATSALEIVSRFVYPLVGDTYSCSLFIYTNVPYVAFGYGYCRDLGYLNACGFYCNADGEFFVDPDGINYGADRWGEEFTSDDLEIYLEMVKTGRNQEDPFEDVIYPWQTDIFGNVIPRTENSFQSNPSEEEPFDCNPFDCDPFAEGLPAEDPLAHKRSEYNPPKYRTFSPEGMQASRGMEAEVYDDGFDNLDDSAEKASNTAKFWNCNARETEEEE